MDTGWNDQHQAVLEAFAAKFKPPVDEDLCRTWTRKLAEQFRFSFKGTFVEPVVWGTKRADPGRPPSTDCICTQKPFVGYDVIISQGQPDQTLAQYPEGLDLTGQVFIPVDPVDHLNGAPIPIPQPPKPKYPTYEELGGDEGGKKITRQLEADYKRAGRAGLDGDCGAWQQRVSYDFLTGVCKTVEEAITKHRAGWCAALGIPVE